MRIRSNPSPETVVRRSIPVCGALPPSNLAILCGYALVKYGVSIGFLRAAATTRAALFIALGEVLHRSPVFEHNQNRNRVD